MATSPPQQAVSFDWDFGEGSPVPSTNRTEAHTYSASGQRTVTVTMHSPGCPDQVLQKEITVECGAKKPPDKVVVVVKEGPATGKDGGCGCLGCLCALLLGAAIALLAAAVALAFVFGCSIETGPPLAATVWAGLVSAVLFGIAILLFGLWANLCGRFDCNTLNELAKWMRIVSYAELVGGTAIAGSLQSFCVVGVLISGGYLSLAANLLTDVALSVGCLRRTSESRLSP